MLGTKLKFLFKGDNNIIRCSEHDYLIYTHWFRAVKQNISCPNQANLFDTNFPNVFTSIVDRQCNSEKTAYKMKIYVNTSTEDQVSTNGLCSDGVSTIENHNLSFLQGTYQFETVNYKFKATCGPFGAEINFEEEPLDNVQPDFDLFYIYFKTQPTACRLKFYAPNATRENYCQIKWRGETRMTCYYDPAVTTLDGPIDWNKMDAFITGNSIAPKKWLDRGGYYYHKTSTNDITTLSMSTTTTSTSTTTRITTATTSTTSTTTITITTTSSTSTTTTTTSASTTSSTTSATTTTTSTTSTTITTSTTRTTTTTTTTSSTITTTSTTSTTTTVTKSALTSIETITTIIFPTRTTSTTTTTTTNTSTTTNSTNTTTTTITTIAIKSTLKQLHPKQPNKTLSSNKTNKKNSSAIVQQRNKSKKKNSWSLSSYVPVLLIVIVVVVFLFASFYFYRSKLQKSNEDQSILPKNNSDESYVSKTPDFKSELADQEDEEEQSAYEISPHPTSGRTVSQFDPDLL
ncbi:unnamed protein product [Adineta ricciae]|uniref:Uncharacterized protein n=1 Tax=Adineta ricciae TaxID=249248 RepID=A0A814B8F8_ADIRI|nr:unnamed protein product [Adineta ricciae]CAF0923378.1 unnamed protein product [Adineta ricciae]